MNDTTQLPNEEIQPDAAVVASNKANEASVPRSNPLEEFGPYGRYYSY